MKSLLFVLLLVLSAACPAALVATNRPLMLIAAEVTRGIEQPEQLLPDGASAHDQALRPSDRLRLQRAELVLWVGPGHERFLRPLLDHRANTLSLETLPGAQRLPWRALDTALPQPGTLDTHLWLAPANAIRLAYALADLRGRQRPADAARYRANADRFKAELQASLGALQARFTALPRRDYLAYHDAYQYLETPLGLHYRGSLSPGPEQKPGLKHLLVLRREVERQHWRCLLTEPRFDAGLARQVFGDQGRYAPVDETFRHAASYREGLEQIADAIHHCLRD